MKTEMKRIYCKSCGRKYALVPNNHKLNTKDFVCCTCGKNNFGTKKEIVIEKIK